MVRGLWRGAYMGYTSEQFSAIAKGYNDYDCGYNFQCRPNKSNICKGCLKKHGGKCPYKITKVSGKIQNALGNCLQSD